MRSVDAQLLEEKIDDAVTHYINSQHQNEQVQVDASQLSLSVPDDASSRIVTVMQPATFPGQVCRLEFSRGLPEEGWGEELLEDEGRLAALVAHLAQHSRPSHHQHQVLKHVTPQQARSEVESIMDTPMRLFNNQSIAEHTDDPIVVEVPALPPLPPLQLKRCSETDWFSKGSKETLKDDHLLQETDPSLELAGSSPAQHKQQNKKSLPHKKRISRRLRRTAQQDIMVINCEEGQHEEILPDNFVTSVQSQDHLQDPHHIAHEPRPLFICQLCGAFYGEEQHKFYQHLKEHYEPHSATIIIENPVNPMQPVNDLAIDKINNTCIVDNVSNLPDSLVELSLENTIPKTSMYQPIEKSQHFTSSEKPLSYTMNKILYSTAMMDKDGNSYEQAVEKGEVYESLDKMPLYSCPRCSKTFKKEKYCEMHIKEAHSKIEEMSEFSEPEDLMEGIHVMVDGEGVEGSEVVEGEGTQTEGYTGNVLPHLTIENGHVHQEHIKLWYMRNMSGAGSAGGAACGACADPMERQQHNCALQLKEEVIQRILEVEAANPQPAESYEENILPEQSEELQQDEQPEQVVQSRDTPPAEEDEKKIKSLECPECARTFKHRNSLMYHVLRHKGSRPHPCMECGKSFYTQSALKVHVRVHNGDKPYKCSHCGRDFRQYGDLKYHILSLHTEKKQHKCEFCGKEFARKYSLSLHRKIHTGERNFKCEYCNKCFRASSYKMAHMRIHTGEKPFSCTECGKTFRVGGDLRRHMLTHDKIRNRASPTKPNTPSNKPQGKTKNDINDIAVEKPKEKPKIDNSNRRKSIRFVFDKVDKPLEDEKPNVKPSRRSKKIMQLVSPKIKTLEEDTTRHKDEKPSESIKNIKLGVNDEYADLISRHGKRISNNYLSQRLNVDRAIENQRKSDVSNLKTNIEVLHRQDERPNESLHRLELRNSDLKIYNSHRPTRNKELLYQILQSDNSERIHEDSATKVSVFSHTDKIPVTQVCIVSQSGQILSQTGHHVSQTRHNVSHLTHNEQNMSHTRHMSESAINVIQSDHNISHNLSHSGHNVSVSSHNVSHSSHGVSQTSHVVSQSHEMTESSNGVSQLTELRQVTDLRPERQSDNTQNAEALENVFIERLTALYSIAPMTLT